MKLDNTNWHVHGISFSKSDALPKILKEAINSDNLEQEYLQKVTGYRNPIIINKKHQTIQFC